MSKVRGITVLALAMVLVLALGSVALAQTTSKVTVKDQEIVNGTVTIEEVDAAQDGWLVVHAQASGNPGPDLGHTAVKAGKNMNVVVTIDVSKATPVLYAMLHIDAGTIGTYEFPGADVPATGAQADVNPTFNITNLAAAQSATPAAAATPVATATAAAAAPGALPKTGGSVTESGGAALLVLGLLCVVAGFGLSQRRLAHRRTED
jgi:hypothetical protein